MTSLAATLCALLVAGTHASQGHLQQRASGVGPESRGNHRLKLIFPLLIRISLRLAELVPKLGMIMMLLLALVVFAKKAFLVSLATLGIVVLDKLKKAPVHQSPAGHHEILHAVPVFKKDSGHSSNNIYHNEKDYSKSILLKEIHNDDFDPWLDK